MITLYTIGFIAALLIAIFLTPIVKRFAIYSGAVDQPDKRKVHTRIMPRMGGLAIYLAFVGAFVIVSPVLSVFNLKPALGLAIGGLIITLTGALDDRYNLRPRWKVLGQLIAAAVVVFGADLRIIHLSIPFSENMTINMDWLSVLITIVWIIGVTNAINLIDGLDGLAAGVSGIATLTIIVLAAIMGNITVILLGTILLGAIVGFLFYNFHPAQIFMGDTGSLFLGFSLATLSTMGFKEATIISLLVPVIVLGVPLADTVFAIIRRIVNKRPISTADKNHLHHSILALGFSHRKTVLVIYGISLVFGAVAVTLSQTLAVWVIILILALLILVLQLGAEMIGLVHHRKKPVIRFARRVGIKSVRMQRNIKKQLPNNHNHKES
jgi:UDP-GlcNAc:undecaprenyl-phosphate GlcNAc-1-phosphate transferase